MTTTTLNQAQREAARHATRLDKRKGRRDWESAKAEAIYSIRSDRDITDPLRISEQNGTTLRHALAGHGLPVSGTKRQQAVRLANAGISAAHVEAWHTWRGRDSGPCVQETDDEPTGETP